MCEECDRSNQLAFNAGMSLTTWGYPHTKNGMKAILNHYAICFLLKMNCCGYNIETSSISLARSSFFLCRIYQLHTVREKQVCFSVPHVLHILCLIFILTQLHWLQEITTVATKKKKSRTTSLQIWKRLNEINKKHFHEICLKQGLSYY